jgi:hypothetical protein
MKCIFCERPVESDSPGPICDEECATRDYLAIEGAE